MSALITRNYIGESYILDKLKEDTIINNSNLLYNNYINQHYLYYLLNDSNGNYLSVLKLVKKIIKYRNKYNLLLNGKCELCYANNEYNPVHSIKYNGINSTGYHIIYIEPASASDFTVSAICQHLLMCFDEVINAIINEIINNTTKNNNNDEKLENKCKIRMVFNMKNNKNSLRNIRIATAMYNIINDCYMKNITEIQVYNFGGFMKFFTKLFNKAFNNKIICY